MEISADTGQQYEAASSAKARGVLWEVVSGVFFVYISLTFATYFVGLRCALLPTLILVTFLCGFTYLFKSRLWMSLVLAALIIQMIVSMAAVCSRLRYRVLPHPISEEQFPRNRSSQRFTTPHPEVSPFVQVPVFYAIPSSLPGSDGGLAADTITIEPEPETSGDGMPSDANDSVAGTDTSVMPRVTRFNDTTLPRNYPDHSVGSRNNVSPSLNIAGVVGPQSIDAQSFYPPNDTTTTYVLESVPVPEEASISQPGEIYRRRRLQRELDESRATLRYLQEHVRIDNTSDAHRKPPAEKRRCTPVTLHDIENRNWKAICCEYPDLCFKKRIAYTCAGFGIISLVSLGSLTYFNIKHATLWHQ